MTFFCNSLYSDGKSSKIYRKPKSEWSLLFILEGIKNYLWLFRDQRVQKSKIKEVANSWLSTTLNWIWTLTDTIKTESNPTVMNKTHMSIPKEADNKQWRVQRSYLIKDIVQVGIF
jgi:hypothetical protein